VTHCRKMDHGTGNALRRCSAHQVSKTLRHHRYQQLQSPAKAFSPRAEAKYTAGTGALHYDLERGISTLRTPSTNLNLLQTPII
jgi:hypothetical protein